MNPDAGVTNIAAPQMAPAASAERAASAPVARRRVASGRYIFCVGLLAASGATMQTLATALGQHFRKLPAPLQRPLAEFDVRKLAPEYTLYPTPPAPLDHEMLQSLGTTEYLNWMLVDTTRPPTDPTAVAHLFVTYYTGKPDMVPHDPNECYPAGGFPRVGPSKPVTLNVPGAGAPGDQVPVELLTFQGRGGLRGDAGLIAVMYFFRTNGEYMTTRNKVRMAQANLARYAYYSKIELKFTDYRLQAAASPEESQAAAQRLLQKVLPVLVQDHYPDLSKLSEPGKLQAGEK